MLDHVARSMSYVVACCLCSMFHVACSMCVMCHVCCVCLVSRLFSRFNCVNVIGAHSTSCPRRIVSSGSVRRRDAEIEIVYSMHHQVQTQHHTPAHATHDGMACTRDHISTTSATHEHDNHGMTLPLCMCVPAGGESLAHVLSRVDNVLTNFHRQAANKRALVVCHGEVMWVSEWTMMGCCWMDVGMVSCFVGCAT